MMRLLRQRGAKAKDGSADADMQQGIAHVLELLVRIARANEDLGLDPEDLRELQLRLRMAKSEDAREAVALDLQELSISSRGLLKSEVGQGGSSPLAAAAIVGHAASSALPVARATGVRGTGAELEGLARVVTPSPPEESMSFQQAMETLAHAVIFLRQRGDVMHTSMGELAHLVASLAEDEPSAALRLERTRSQLATAGSVGELERLRETLLQEAGVLVNEARARADRASEANEMVRLQQAHRRVLELALDSATAMAEMDALTGLGNRRALDRAVTQLAKHGQDVGVVTLDLDHFKSVNDTHGHEAGDLVLRAAAATLQAELRGNDRAFRSGGEEFVLLLPSTDSEGSQRTAERIRKALEDQLVQIPEGAAIRFTASMGVAVWGGRSDYRSAATRSDKALYMAKRNGRNQVVQAD